MVSCFIPHRTKKLANKFAKTMRNTGINRSSSCTARTKIAFCSDWEFHTGTVFAVSMLLGPASLLVEKLVRGKCITSMAFMDLTSGDEVFSGSKPNALLGLAFRQFVAKSQGHLTCTHCAISGATFEMLEEFMDMADPVDSY